MAKTLDFGHSECNGAKTYHDAEILTYSFTYTMHPFILKNRFRKQNKKTASSGQGRISTPVTNRKGPFWNAIFIQKMQRSQPAMFDTRTRSLRTIPY